MCLLNMACVLLLSLLSIKLLRRSGSAVLLLEQLSLVVIELLSLTPLITVLSIGEGNQEVLF